MSENNAHSSESQANHLERRIALMRWVGYFVLFAERFVIAVLPALGVISLFLIVSWFGLWRTLPVPLKIAGLVMFGLAFLYGLVRLAGLTFPAKNDIDRRLEEQSGLQHQAISVQAEKPVGTDAFSLALWKEHQRRMARQIDTISAGPPSPDIARRDPFALRAPLLLLLVVAWSFSWSNYGGRIADSIDYSEPLVAAGGPRIDAWVTPPAYTGVAPIYLTSNEKAPLREAFSVPQFSVVTIRISGGTGAVTFTGENTDKPITLKADKKPENPKTSESADAVESYTLKLSRSGQVAIASREFDFSVIADTKPEIRFAKEPDRAANGALEIAFEAKDNYGIVSAKAEILPSDADPKATPLFGPPVFNLDIPGSNTKHVKATTSRDLTEHPLSGKKVKLTLVATDAAGLEARSETREIILPQRIFTQALAGSIAEQRQVFSLDVNQIPRALLLSEVAGFRADETIPNPSHYILLQSTRHRLKLANTVAALEEAATYFWDVARFIEDGDLSSAEKRLRNAQQKLSDALARNAGDKEIAELMKELRQAMKDYLAELAKRMDKSDANRMASQMQRMMRMQDFDKMMDQLENLARSGSREQAQQMLSEMQRMLNNLQTARPRNGQKQNPMLEQIDKLGKLVQKQQKLMEDTHRKELALRDRLQRGDPSEEGLTENMIPRQGENSGAPSAEDKMTADELQDALKGMRDRQLGIISELGALQKSLKELGMKTIEGFGEASKEMGESSIALGKAEGQNSVDAQGRAIDALTKGAGEMMQQLREASKGGPGQSMPMPGGEQAGGRDPLGRERADSDGPGAPDDDSGVKVPDQIDIQRAREILDQIRRRLGNVPTSIIEKEYLERLLDLR